ncbi:MAG: hypothetical protein HPY83_08495 [Anaerolineae bacterium]|nr:hypothetical protein [Anaerolineae bacterium]
MDSVNVAPFAAKVVTDQPGEYSLWWEDPRVIERVEVRFSEPVGREELPELYYWQHTWPRVRLAKNAVVGSGEQGWLPIDDWITGQWRRAACSVEGEGGTWTYTFLPLDQEDVPSADEFPVRFRRTLRVRLAGNSAGAIRAVAAYSDSEWRETEICFQWGGMTSQAQRWDGRLEAFNGYVLSVQPWGRGAEVGADGSWRSSVNGNLAGVRARVRYAHNEDRNSYDRTIVTLRSEVLSFSVDMRHVLAEGTLYLPDFGVAVGQAEGYPGLAAIAARWEAGRGRSITERVEELPEQTWDRVRREQPRTEPPIYFVLGCEGGRQKARLHPNGDLELFENYIRRVRGRDSDRLLWEGPTLRYSFGLPGQFTGRSLAEGYLPVVRADWVARPITYEQDAFATWLLADIGDDSDKPGDDPVVALLRFTLMNAGTEPAVGRLALSTADKKAEGERLAVSDGLVYAMRDGERRLRAQFDIRGRGALKAGEAGATYEVALAPGDYHCVVVKVPLITLSEEEEELTALDALQFEEQRRKAVAFWQRRVAQGAQIETPNPDLNRFYKAHLTHMLIVNDREPGSERLAPRCGGFHYGNFPDEGIMCTADLDRRGYAREAERCLEIMVHYQGTVPLPGDFETHFGVLYGSNGYEMGGYNRGQGWAMWGLADHYRITRDREWLERVAPAMVKACDWVTHERRRTMELAPDGSRPIEFGFLPAGSLEDVTDYWHWLSSNAYACWGFQAIADVLAEAGHPEGERLQAEAAAFRADLMVGFNESRARSPIVKLADGRWVPYWPARLERRGRDFGWLREVLEGSMGLLLSEMISTGDPAARWILDDYEDNLYLSEEYGYPGTMPDFDGHWFDWGGFSMQSNLLLHPLLYLRRDQVKPFLRAFFNGFYSTYFEDVSMLAEHNLPTLADWRGDHFKTSDEANVIRYLRLMLVEDWGDTLTLGKAIPREWLEHGKGVRVERVLTYFGEVSYTIASRAGEGLIEAEVHLPQRHPPARARLRLRHPEMTEIRRVALDGSEWAEFDPVSETIELPAERKQLRVRAYYA